MSDRRLIVGEFDSLDANNGKLFALAPGDANGIPIPSFQVGAARPAVGSIKGEGYYDILQKQGFVWTGSAWRNIAPNPILTFTSEALLLADTTASPGTYATAGDTGSLFIKVPTGWRQVGIKPYATAADLFGDAVAATGALGEVLDEDSLWEKTATGWRLMLIREMATTAAITAWTNTSPGATVGDRAVDKSTGVTYMRLASGWRPISIWEETEANIRAATWALNGQEAIATDTGRVFARAAGKWIEEPIAHYPTEAALLAAVSQPGTLAWSDDTNVVFVRVAGTPAGPGGTPAAKPDTWKRLQGSHVSVGTTAPTTPGEGDQWYDRREAHMKVWEGTAWKVTGKADERFFEAEITLGANADTIGNEIILLKGLAATNDGVYISIVDMEVGHNHGRTSYAVHAFTTDSVGDASMVPLHIEARENRLEKLHWFWKDGTDSYCLSAVTSQRSANRKFNIGMMSPTANFSGVTVDGNTVLAGAGGAWVKSKPAPIRPLYQYASELAMTTPQHIVVLDEPATRFTKMEGIVSCAASAYTVRPYLRFGTTVFNFTDINKIFHVFAMARYDLAGLRDTGNTFIQGHHCGFTFINSTNYGVKASATFSLRMTVTKRTDDYWEVWQEAFYGSSNDTPMKMDSKYEIGTAGLGDLTAIGVETYDFPGTTAANSSYALNVESL
jgi:hypothetical protein